jgi:hypothetical protein
LLASLVGIELILAINNIGAELSWVRSWCARDRLL